MAARDAGWGGFDARCEALPERDDRDSLHAAGSNFRPSLATLSGLPRVSGVAGEEIIAIYRMGKA